MPSEGGGVTAAISLPLPSRQRIARALVRTVSAMARDGRPLMARILPPDEVAAWDHYPDDDARDPASGCRYYYHVHEPGDRPDDEHGHFHLFLPRCLFVALTPMAVPPDDDPERPELVHLAGLSIDHQGLPLRWFATNRHVTDEYMYPGLLVARRLPRFRLSGTGGDPLVDRFLTQMVHLYRDDLTGLLVQRDATLLALGARRAGRKPFERGHDVLAARAIDLDSAIESLLVAS